MNSIFYLPTTYEVTYSWPILLFSYLVFPLAIIFSIKKFLFVEYKKEKEIFSIDNTMTYRGIAAVVVMIHHFSLKMVNPGKMFYYWFVGYLVVSVFFFLSGYASFIQLQKKGDDFWNGYFIKRLSRLILPFFVINTINAVFYRPSPLQYICAMFSLKQMRGQESEWSVVWFLTAILIFTVLYYISFRWMKNRNMALLIFLLGTILYLLVHVVVLHSPNYWFNSSFAYVSGIFYAMKKTLVDKFVSKNVKILIPISSVIWIGIFFAMTKGYQFWLIQIICAEVLLCLLICVEHCITFRNSPIKRIGKASWEVFLLHPLFYSVYYSVFADRYGLSAVVVILISILVGILINMFDEFLLKKVLKI